MEQYKTSFTENQRFSKKMTKRQEGRREGEIILPFAE
jgi:hypothetical protein